MLPIAYFSHWMEHTFAGIVSYYGIFIAIYIIIWFIQYSMWKYRIRQINNKIKNDRVK
ncbi:DUF3021 family protein [Clostridium sp. HV4-5-A1G]|nr:DUF3021 family protein [Clostridium sp. HV4-5-A1G]